MRRLIHVQAATGDQIHAALSLKLAKQAGIIGFRVHGNVGHLIFDMKGFQPHAFGFVGAVSHPQKTA